MSLKVGTSGAITRGISNSSAKLRWSGIITAERALIQMSGHVSVDFFFSLSFALTRFFVSLSTPQFPASPVPVFPRLVKLLIVNWQGVEDLKFNSPPLNFYVYFHRVGTNIFYCTCLLLAHHCFIIDIFFSKRHQHRHAHKIIYT